MSGPSVKFYFDTEDDYWAVVKLAAQHDLKTPEFVKRCVIKVHNDIVAEQNAALAAQQETTNEEVQPADEPVQAEVSSSEEGTPSETPTSGGSESAGESK